MAERSFDQNTLRRSAIVLLNHFDDSQSVYLLISQDIMAVQFQEFLFFFSLLQAVFQRLVLALDRETHYTAFCRKTSQLSNKTLSVSSSILATVHPTS